MTDPIDLNRLRALAEAARNRPVYPDTATNFGPDVDAYYVAARDWRVACADYADAVKDPAVLVALLDRLVALEAEHALLCKRAGITADAEARHLDHYFATLGEVASRAAGPCLCTRCVPAHGRPFGVPLAKLTPPLIPWPDTEALDHHLGLSVRALNVLHAAEKLTVGDVRNMSDLDILRLKNAGRVTLRELRAVCGGHRGVRASDRADDALDPTATPVCAPEKGTDHVD